MNELQALINILSDLVLLIGLSFVFIAVLGLLRFPDVYNRLHATAKIGTVGALGVMLSILLRTGLSPIGVKAIAVGLFLMLTSPIAVHMITRSAHRYGTELCSQSCIDQYATTYKHIQQDTCKIKK